MPASPGKAPASPGWVLLPHAAPQDLPGPLAHLTHDAHTPATVYMVIYFPKLTVNNDRASAYSYFESLTSVLHGN